MRLARVAPLCGLAFAGFLLLPSDANGELFASGGADGLYRIDEATGVATRFGPALTQFVNAMAIDPSGTVYIAGRSISPNQQQLATVDPTTASLLKEGPAIAFHPGALSFSTAGVLYAAEGDDIYTLDLESGANTLVGNAGLPRLHRITGLAFSPDGTLYGWDAGTSGELGLALLTIDPLTGAATDVDPTVHAPVLPPYGEDAVTALAFAPEGTLYGANRELYTVNLQTGGLTLIAPMPNLPDAAGITGMVWIPEPSTLTGLATFAAALVLAHLRRKRKRS